MKMTKILLSGVAAAALCGASAYAADLPVKAPSLPSFKAPVSVYNWTGFYVGANVGLGVSQTTGFAPRDQENFDDDIVGSIDRSGVGFAGGVQAGYNWQFAPQWVVGAEGDIGILDINRTFRNFDSNRELGVDTRWYATLRGRLGYTNGPSLFYVTGGAAFVDLKNNNSRTATNNGGALTSSASETASGWTIGGGAETLLGGNWSAKVEYLYIDAGSQDVNNPALVDQNIFHYDNAFHVYRYGLNYKFGAPTASGPLPAHNWTGLYVGVNAGPALLQDAASSDAVFGRATRGRVVNLADNGFAAGGQIGYNWQFSPLWVVGLEGDIGYIDVNRDLLTFDGQEHIVFGAKSDWYGTVRGRVGYTTGPALLYVTGGTAFVHVRNSFDDQLTASFASKSKTAVGWTLGGGIEAAVAPNWTVKTEYLYIDAGSQDVFNPNVDGNAQPAHFDNRFHVFRFGLNYAFNR